MGSPPPAPGDAPLPLSRLSQLFESAADGVYFVAPDQTIVFWNAAAERITGQHASGVLGKQCYDVIGGTDFLGRCFCRRDCNTISCVRRGEAVEHYDVLARPSPGVRLWVNVSIISLLSAEYDEPVAVHVFRDVGARRRESELLAGDTFAAVAGGAPGAPVVEAVPPQLTAREIDVLRLLAGGATVRAIAEQLVVTRATARNHIENLMGKLGVHSRLEAVVYAAHHGILDHHPLD